MWKVLTLLLTRGIVVIILVWFSTVCLAPCAIPRFVVAWEERLDSPDDYEGWDHSSLLCAGTSQLGSKGGACVRVKRIPSHIVDQAMSSTLFWCGEALIFSILYPFLSRLMDANQGIDYHWAVVERKLSAICLLSVCEPPGIRWIQRDRWIDRPTKSEDNIRGWDCNTWNSWRKFSHLLMWRLFDYCSSHGSVHQPMRWSIHEFTCNYITTPSVSMSKTEQEQGSNEQRQLVTMGRCPLSNMRQEWIFMLSDDWYWLLMADNAI